MPYRLSQIPTRIDLELKLLFRDEKPANNRLSHGTAPLSHSLHFFFFFYNFSVCDKTEGTSRDSVYSKGFVHATCGPGVA